MHVMVMQPPVLSLSINYLALFDVTMTSEVAFFNHQLRHLNPSTVLSVSCTRAHLNLSTKLVDTLK